LINGFELKFIDKGGEMNDKQFQKLLDKANKAAVVADYAWAKKNKGLE